MLTLAIKGEQMSFQFSRQGMAAMPLAVPLSQSSFVRRLLLARDDAVKQRVLGWLMEMDDARLRGFGLSIADITMLRASRDRTHK